MSVSSISAAIPLEITLGSGQAGESRTYDAYDLKGFKKLSPDLTNIAIINYDSFAAYDLARLMKTCPHITTFSLHTGDSSPENFSDALAELPNLESLDLGDAWWDRDADAILNSLCKHCPKLRNLVLWLPAYLPGNGAIPFSAIGSCRTRYSPAALLRLHQKFGLQLELESYTRQFSSRTDRWRRVDFSS